MGARAEALLVAALLFASGGAALLYEVLWLEQLGLLFGNTAQAAAVTLAVFFLGLSLGAWIWGHRAARSSSPLHAFAGLEIGIAVSALPYFVLLDLYQAIYPALATVLRGVPVALTLARLGLVASILLLRRSLWAARCRS